MTLSCNRISSTTKRCELFAKAQPPHTHRAPRNSGARSSQSPRNSCCVLQNIPAVLWSCAGCLLFLPPSPSRTRSTATAIFRNPLVAAERFPPAGTSRRSPRRRAGISSACCEGFANQVISTALHHTGVYIRLCGSLHTNRHLNCI